MSSKRSSMNRNRRRFSDDQIRSLETTFESESRPELRLKQHLANKLGLQPRQVAIWFQNKRARSKSKHIEGQYTLLKANYDNLAQQFDALRQENQTLLLQLQRLRKMAECKKEVVGIMEEDFKNNNNNNNNNNNDYNSDDGKGRFCGDRCGHAPPCSEEEYRQLEEEADVFDMVRMASPENGCSFESATFLDHTSHLWDF
ncbi:homeobox-leucine zipper protein ATHB-12-like [Andrographis paniculata]|uniref:homeobox-leucine zipper protein ATHB-12-like n=1 Tax=Andrographis paniculata TaxID=175694 RepID=UPI0021E7B3BF|nr:homeobox-leucine zipper protein ATHB-12-like [Andrographis paniculata]